MVSAIAPALIPGTGATTGTDAVSLEAKIARYKQELSDCINCESAKTSQGKADIQRISNLISIAEARLSSVKASKQNSQADPSSTTASNAAASSTENETGTESATTPTSTSSTLGKFVDVFV